MWVADTSDEKLYAYVLTSGDTFGNHVSAKDITLPLENFFPRGIWSDGTTMWVSDGLEDKLYAYVLTPGDTFGNRVSAKDIALAIDAPMGIWSDGTTMWVAESVDNKLYAYALASGDPLPPLDLALDTDDTDSALDNDDPRGIWSDGTTMWVLDSGDDKLYTYALTRAEDLTRTEIWSASVTVTQSDIFSSVFGYGASSFPLSSITDRTLPPTTREPSRSCQFFLHTSYSKLARD